MASIFLDPEKLQRKIDSLQAMADECKRVNVLLDADSESHGDPYLKFTDFYEAVPEAARTVADRATTIKNIKDKIVQLNQNGVGVKDKETGTITCEIPEGVTIESKEGFDQWAQGATDAHDLQQLAKSGKNKTKDGRTYDEVIASMEANKSNSNHTNSFIDTIGAENLTGLPLVIDGIFMQQSPYGSGGQVNVRPDAGPELADLLGTMLATSSRTWSADKAQNVAEDIRSSVDERGEYGRITVLNAMIGGHDADGNGVTDLRFGTDFLVSMGRRWRRSILRRCSGQWRILRMMARTNPVMAMFQSMQRLPLASIFLSSRSILWRECWMPWAAMPRRRAGSSPLRGSLHQRWILTRYIG